MKLTWQILFSLTEEMFDITQARIAELVGVHPTTISNAKRGKTKKFDYERYELYKNLFDPNNKESPAHGMKRTEKDLLEDFKSIIKNKGYGQDIKGFNECNDYKSLVMGMLGSINEGQQVEENTRDKKKEASRKNKGMQMREIFMQHYRDNHIAEFLEQDVTSKDFNQDLLPWVKLFIDRIKSDIIKSFSNKQKKKTYQNIVQYIDTLRNYKKCIKKNINNSHSTPINVEIIASERLRLNKLYEQINCKYTEDNNKEV